MTEQIHKLGEVLRTAREAKGLDLPRVERETKIRQRYLSALERGEYRELPGAVYTKGFLRNYGSYLGLDPEYLVDLYRLESAAALAERPTMPTAPRPLRTRRARAFVVTPGALLGTILTIGVAMMVVWIGWEFANFAGTPELRIVDPAGTVANHPRTTYTFRGVTEPNARVTVDGAVENPTVAADESGEFAVEVRLVPGSNMITLVAFDPVTRRDSDAQSRTIVVQTATASPTPGAVALTLDQPQPNSTHAAAVPIAGRATPGAQVQAVASLVAPATPTFTVTDAGGQPVTVAPQPPAAPQPLVLTAAADGAFAGELLLAPGTWSLAMTDAGASTAPTTVQVAVAEPAGLVGRLRIEGGDSWIEADTDGTPAEGVTRRIARSGEEATVQATGELRILAGNAAVVRLTINGLDLGPMGGQGSVVEWRITRSGG